MPLLFPLWWLDENTMPFAFVAIVVAALAGGGAILILLLMSSASLQFARGAPPGAGVLRRSLVGLLFLFLLMTAFGVALGTDGPHGRGLRSVLIRLIWSEPTSPWLWAGRIGALGLIGVGATLYRIHLSPARPGRREAIERPANGPEGSPGAGPPHA